MSTTLVQTTLERPLVKPLRIIFRILQIQLGHCDEHFEMGLLANTRVSK